MMPRQWFSLTDSMTSSYWALQNNIATCRLAMKTMSANHNDVFTLKNKLTQT